MLAVEMDGEQHDVERDSVRDTYFESLGIYTYRIPNIKFFQLENEPYKNFVAEIERLCRERT